MTQAVEAYRRITVTPEFKEAERLRSKARHDEAQALFNERRKIAANLLKINIPIEQIVTATSLTHAELETIRITD